MPTALDDLAARIAALEAALLEVSRSSRLSHSSIDDGALTVTSGGQLRAVIGQQPDGTTGVNVVNGPTPPVPAVPTATPILGGVRVGWDGTFADGAPSPLDLARVEVHAATAVAFTPSAATLVTTIDTPQGGIATVPTGTPVWVVLVARTTSGKASAPSRTAFAGPAPVVAQEVLAGIVGELQLADDAVTAAKVAAGAIDADALAAAAVTAVKIGEAAIVAGKIAANAVTNVAIAADAVTAREIATGAITTAELAAGSVNTVNLAAGAITAAQISANSITTAKIAAGAITAAQLAADSVAAGKIAASTITGREIKALAITADKIAVNSITAAQLAAGAVTATALAADAIDGKTITGVTITGGTITGGTIRTGLSGRRVLLAPVDPTDGSATPSALLYSGAAAEKAPARLTGEVRELPDGSSPTTRLTAPQVATDGSHTPRLLLSSGGPTTGYAPKGTFTLDVSGPGGLAGQAMVTGAAGTGTDSATEASVQMSVRRTDGSNKTALTLISPSQWMAQLVDQIAAMYLDKNGLVIKALQGEVLLQTGTGLRLQGGGVDVGAGIVKNSSTWTAVTFQNGCSQVSSWQAVTFKKRPDGMVSVRGLLAVPAGMAGGLVATISDPTLRPKAGEVFAVATASGGGATLFVQPNGNLEVWPSAAGFGGWVSFGSTQWSCVD
ncbi:hypothetical protein [Kitasatospora sp. NPDC057223]|uniref:hypothetical protein n=1 Tax=Kitasatospora sp. NPDC057223 TaxID=3346055 RepID=UPI00363F056C